MFYNNNSGTPICVPYGDMTCNNYQGWQDCVDTCDGLVSIGSCPGNGRNACYSIYGCYTIKEPGGPRVECASESVCEGFYYG